MSKKNNDQNQVPEETKEETPEEVTEASQEKQESSQEEALQQALREQEDKYLRLLAEYDAVILDIMLPQMDGIEVLKLLRAKGIATPVMMLTAKGEKEDRIKGFDTGADDYLPKPFDPDELLARVRAMLRRGGGYTPNVIAFGDLALDCGEGILRCGNRSERLSGREFQVMELFMRAPRAIVSAERIMERIWGWESDAEINVVWVHISNLRKKLAVVGSSVVIRVSRGLGYSLEEGK